MAEFDRENNSQLSKYQEFKTIEFLVFFFLAKAVELQCEAVQEMRKKAFRSGTDNIPMLNFADR